MPRDRAVLLTEIADGLPEIVRGLIGHHPLKGGDWELTVAQMRALGVIGGHADCTMGELARHLGISLSAATGLADRLVQQGLVEREANPKDRRLVCLRLAAAGRRARGAFRREKRRRMDAAFGRLSTQELEQIADSLSLLRKAVGLVVTAEEEKS